MAAVPGLLMKALLIKVLRLPDPAREEICQGRPEKEVLPERDRL